MIALFGIGYILFPILFTPIAILGIYLDRKRYKYYLYAIILNLALIGYHFEPLISDDLYSHFMSMDKLRLLGVRNIFALIPKDPLLIKNLWFYLVSLTNIKSLLPFSAIILTYFIIIRDIISFSEKEKIGHILTINIILIILIFFQLIWVMSGVRFSVSIALFFHGLYREFILKKKNMKTYLFYIIPLFIHYSTFVLIFIRILSVLKKKFKIVVVTGMLIWGLFPKIIISILSRIGISYIQEVVLKSELYFEYINNSPYMLLTNLIKLFYCLVLIFCFIYLRKKRTSIYEKYKNIYDYGLLISLFCIGGTSFFIILDRFGFVVLIFLPLFLMPVLQHNRNILVKQLSTLSVIPIISIGLYLQYIPLKATNYDVTLFEFFTRDILRIFIK